MIIQEAKDPQAWDAFLTSQRYKPFLQSWTMGEVYRDIHQEPIRLEARDGDHIAGICQAISVPARRGRHLSVPYGPVLAKPEALEPILEELKKIAREKKCAFIRMSPFWQDGADGPSTSLRVNDRHLRILNIIPSPLHLLAEHVWYVPLKNPDVWDASIPRPLPPVEEGGARIKGINEIALREATKEKKISPPPPVEEGLGVEAAEEQSTSRPEAEIFSNMRSTARNLIRRAEKEGVTIIASEDPLRDLPQFLALHDETRKRHGFTPYTDAFFRAQIARFAPRKECTLYLAKYQGETIAASIHMHIGGETSYHHGASAEKYKKIPASYLLQWTAIQDALKRGDHVYNFWGIAPIDEKSKVQVPKSKHPFAGVTLFKTGFGGNVLNLVHCFDIPLSPMYHLTRTFEQIRKWKRGF